MSDVKTLAKRYGAVVVWVAGAVTAMWLYGNEAREGQMLAYSEVVEVEVTAAVSGRIDSAHLEVGQIVKPDDIVVSLDPNEIDERVRIAAEDLARAEARAKMQGERLSVLKLSEAKQAVCNANPQRLRLEIDQLSSEQIIERGERDMLAGEIQKMRDLTDKQLVTGARLDQLTMRSAVLDKRISARAEQLAMFEACFSVVAEDEVREAREKHDKLARERSKYDVKAPIAGTISEVLHKPGEFIRKGTPIARIVEERRERMTVYVSGRQLPGIDVGSRAVLTPREHGGDALHGKVIALGPRFERVPLRLSYIPTIPQWGRIATIQVDPPGAAIAGELYNVGFEP